MVSTYLIKAKVDDVEHGNVITTSLPTDDAKILARGYDGSVAYTRYNTRFNSKGYMPNVPWVDTFWDDLRVAVSSVRIQGVSNIPAWGAFKTGLQVLWFDDTTMAQVFFAVQIPHK